MKIPWRLWSGSLRRKGLKQRLKHHKIRERFGNIILCLLLAVYAFVGAAVFYAIEKPAQEAILTQHSQDVKLARSVFVQEIMNLTAFGANLNQTKVEVLIENYEISIGCDSLYSEANYHWTYWNAFYYAATIYTTIGFGNLYCRTQSGRILTIFYALFGIPLTLLVLDMIGYKLFNRASKIWVFLKRKFADFHKKFHSTTQVKGVSFRKTSKERIRGEEETETQDETLPLCVSFFLVTLYIFVISAIFTAVEPSWNYLTSIYFFFVTLSTIGLGDEVPRSEGVGFMLMFACVLIGLALLSMCFNTMQSMVESRYKKALKEVLNVLDLSSDCASYASFDRNRLSTEMGLDSDFLGFYRKTYRLSAGTIHDISRHSRRSRNSLSSSMRATKARERVLSATQMAQLRRSIDATHLTQSHYSLEAMRSDATARLVAAARALSGFAERQPSGKLKKHSSTEDLNLHYAAVRRQLQTASKLSTSRKMTSSVSRAHSAKETGEAVLVRRFSSSTGDLREKHSVSVVVEADIESDIEHNDGIVAKNLSHLSAVDLLSTLESGGSPCENGSIESENGLNFREFSPILQVPNPFAI